MRIYEALEKDHKKIGKLLDELVQHKESGDQSWKSLLEQIRDELIPHSRAEEAVFYNAIRELNPQNQVTRTSYMEHAMAETDLRALQAMNAIDVKWTKLAEKLRTDILDHVKREETEVFETAKPLFSEEESKMIGKAFEEMKPIVKKQSFMGTTIDLISNMLPRRLIPGFKKGLSKETKRAA